MIPVRAVRALLAALALLLWAPAAVADGLPPVTSADRSIGRADAPVTVVEYASFACPHCASWHEMVWPLFKARFVDTGQVRFVFRNFPTQPAQTALSGAALARCAAPDRFFDVASALMKGQNAVLHGGTFEDWYAPAIAVSGRTRTQIDACVADPRTLAAIQADVNGADAAGVTHTPTFFVNGRQVADRSFGGLVMAITPLLGGR